MLKFRCPYCTQKVSTTNEFVGREAICPNCGNLITIPRTMHDETHLAHDLKAAEEWKSMAIEQAKLDECERRRRDRELAIKELELSQPNLAAWSRNIMTMSDDLCRLLLIKRSPSNRRFTLKAVDLGQNFVLNNSDLIENCGLLKEFQNWAKVVSEMFIFHGWVTQFVVRRFTSYVDTSNSIVNELIYFLNFNGQVFLAVTHGVIFKGLPSNVAESLRGINVVYSASDSFEAILDSRWQQYDRLYLECHGKYEEFAQNAICEAVLHHCGTSDPLARGMLIINYLRRLVELQNAVIKGGLWNVR